MSKDKNKRYCPWCSEWKEKDEFASDGKDRGLRRTCKSCTYQRKKQKKQDKNERKSKLMHALMELARNDLDRLAGITESDFIENTNASDHVEEFTYSTIKGYAEAYLLQNGYNRPKVLDLPPGRYLVGGDSHGKHTKTKMFDLLKAVNQYLAVDKFIHIGHMLDDDNDISYHWNDFDNLVVLARTEEIQTVEKIAEKKDYNFQIVRDEIIIKDHSISTQDMIRDYTKQYIKSLDSELFPDNLITNLHRQEIATRTTFDGDVLVYSPGCLCEGHIVETIKQIDFNDGYQIKQAKTSGFVKYRRMKHMYRFWQQGLLLVDYDGENVTVTPLKIAKIGKQYVTSYFDKIITADGVENPDNKIFISSDYHVPFHDRKVLDIQEKVCEDYKPDVFVNAGDFMDGDSLNHHMMDKGHPVQACILKEFALGHHILKRMSTWAPKSYVIHGNHERFYDDFTNKYPQLSNLLNFKVLSNVDDLGYECVDLKDVLKIGSLHIIHGDLFMYGQGGSKQEKASRTFGGDVIMGHVHYPAKRFNGYSIGLTGQLDQDYNEVNASNWVHGFGMVNQYKGVNFIFPVSILNHKLLLNDTLYEPEEDDFWDIGEFSAKIEFKY